MDAKVTHTAIEATEAAVDQVIEKVKELPGIKEDEIIVARILNDPKKFVVVHPV